MYTLPRLYEGGSRIRKIEHIQLAAFLLSVDSTENLVNHILSFHDLDEFTS